MNTLRYFDSEKHLESSFHDRKATYPFFMEMQLPVHVDFLRYNL